MEDNGHHHDAIESNSDGDKWQEGVVLSRPPPSRKDKQGTAKKGTSYKPSKFRSDKEYLLQG